MAKRDDKWWCSECRCLVDTPNEHSKSNLSHHIFRVNGEPVHRTEPVPGYYYESDLGVIFGPLSSMEN